MAKMPGVPFWPAKSYTIGRPAGTPRLIVIHYTAGAEGPTSAEDGARYDQRRTDGTSCHVFVDQNSKVQTVDTKDRAHSALFNGNRDGLHIEMCGTVQSPAQWRDAASRGTIRQAAEVCVWMMRAHSIPLVRLVGRQVRTGKGICGHADITSGYPEDGGTHTDPGRDFPWDLLFADIRSIMEGTDSEEDLPVKITVDGDIASLTDGYFKVGDEIELERFLQLMARFDQNAARDARQALTLLAESKGREEAMLVILGQLTSGGGGSVDMAAVKALVESEGKKSRQAMVASYAAAAAAAKD